MEALYPGCTTRIKQPPDVSAKVLDQNYHTRQNVYSSTSTTDTISPILPQQNSTLYCVSSHNPRCATMPSRTRLSLQYPQAPLLTHSNFLGILTCHHIQIFQVYNIAHKLFLAIHNSLDILPHHCILIFHLH